MALLRLTRQATGILPCDEGLLYEVLTDYDSYSEWMPFVAKSKLLAREGDLAIVEFDVTTPRHHKLLIECIHTKNKMVLGRPIGGGVFVTRIQWDIEPAEQGQSSVKLTIQGGSIWHWVFPANWKLVNARGCLDALRSYISLVLPDLGVPDKEGEKILELVETDEGLVLWFRGRKYTLKAGV